MIPHKKIENQMSFSNNFEDILNQKHPLYVLAQRIDWQQFEEAFLPLYCQYNGRPAKPIHLMVDLLIRKHVRNVSDEVVGEQWSENSYCPYFCGEKSFVPDVPCNATEPVLFRKRIGGRGLLN